MHGVKAKSSNSQTTHVYSIQLYSLLEPCWDEQAGGAGAATLCASASSWRSGARWGVALANRCKSKCSGHELDSRRGRKKGTVMLKSNLTSLCFRLLFCRFVLGGLLKAAVKHLRPTVGQTCICLIDCILFPCLTLIWQRDSRFVKETQSQDNFLPTLHLNVPQESHFQLLPTRHCGILIWPSFCSRRQGLTQRIWPTLVYCLTKPSDAGRHL